MVINKYTLGILILVVTVTGFAVTPATPVTSVTSPMPVTSVTPTTSKVAASATTVSNPALIIKSAMIDNIDRDANNMNTLKRQLELEKIRADIIKVKTGGDGARALGDTTVTSIYIDANDPVHGKYATLQFIDGSSFDVELGAKVGAYTVSNISMAGVSLVQPNCKAKSDNCMRVIKVGRLYAKTKEKEQKAEIKNDSDITATPVVNLHDDNDTILNGSKNQMVPPIITKGL